MAKVIPVKVAVRVRPLSRKENDERCQSVVRVSAKIQSFLCNMTTYYTFALLCSRSSRADPRST